MLNIIDKKEKKITLERAIHMIWCFGLALFWVVFIWSFWEKGIFALGLNAFIFYSLTLPLFLLIGYRKKYYNKHDSIWMVPLFLIIISFLIYDNPFLKIFSFLVLPVFAAIFINYGFLKNKNIRYWDINFVSQFISRVFFLLIKINEAVNSYIKLFIPKGGKRGEVIVKIIIGLILFLIIAVAIIIPLLSSADSIFAERIDFFYTWIKDVLSSIFIYKSVVFLLLAIFLFSASLAWGKKFDFEEKKESEKKIDSIISGIVLGGILVLYLLFLFVQLERLWIDRLPIDFGTTEVLVKSGFWQLFFLSVINIVIYFFTYRRTAVVVQRILTLFTFASLLILFSAGHRMILYVINYGLSYEKFFASYTIIYITVLFIWLISRLFLNKRANIFKFVVLLFLWMFAFISVLPVESIILHTNISLVNREESRIRLFELTMLSSDVLGAVKKYESAGLLKEDAGYLEREGEEKTEDQFDWKPWIEKQEKFITDKKWYEKNVMNLINSAR